MPTDTHIFANGLCIPAGGVLTVTREILSSMAAQRPDWRFTLLLSEGRPVHREFLLEPLPSNVSLSWAPAATANRAFRLAWENVVLPRWAAQNAVTAALQVNGMMVPALNVPTLSHAGDPWPYRHDLWKNASREGIVAALKRHEHARALRKADFVGWTSGYLRDLVCDYFGFQPLKSEVFYNGLPEASRARARQPFTPWATRPMEVLTVSAVVPYKRQSLVIEAVAALSKRPGFEALRYRIVGDCSPAYRVELMKLAASLGIADRVVMEGRVSEERVQQTLAGARAFAFMSVCECFGIPPLEAMTFGTPVVAADCCSAREIYGDAVEYCPPDDLTALVESLARVLTDERRVAELRSLGATRTQAFSWDTTAAQMSQHLHDLSGNSSLQGRVSTQAGASRRPSSPHLTTT
jgi:glycosyltransferase involved in cell wall biosynthesis